MKQDIYFNLCSELLILKLTHNNNNKKNKKIKKSHRNCFAQSISFEQEIQLTDLANSFNLQNL